MLQVVSTSSSLAEVFGEGSLHAGSHAQGHTLAVIWLLGVVFLYLNLLVSSSHKFLEFHTVLVTRIPPLLPS